MIRRGKTRGDLAAGGRRGALLGTLLLEDGQRLLQARNLLLAALLALLVRLGLRHALGLQLLPVLEDRPELRLRGAEVRLGLLQVRLGLLLVLVLVLHLGRLRRRGDAVVLGDRVVLLLGLVLGRGALGEHLREVALGHLEHADDTAGGAGALGVLRERHGRAEVAGVVAALEQLRGVVLLRVVVAENLQRHLHTLQALLEVALRLRPGRLLGRADLVRGLLLRRDLPELLLEHAHLLLELRDLRRGLVDLRGQVVHLTLLVVALRLGLGHLLVAEGLLVGLLLRLREQLLNHLLHLGEGVRAEHDLAADAHRELREGRDAHVLRERLERADHARRHATRARARARLRRGLELQEGVVRALRGAARLLLQDLLRHGQRLELRRALLLLHLVLLRARHALVLEVLELLLVVRDLLRHALELTRGRGVRLLGHGLALLRRAELALLRLDRVREALLEHLEVVVRLHLRLLPVRALRLRLLEHVLHGRHDAAGLGLVRLRSRGARGLEHVVLQEGLELRLVRRAHAAHAGRRDEGAERIRHLLHGVGLQEHALAHLLLEDGDGAAQHADGLRELRVRGREVLRLLLADRRRGLEVLAVRRDRIRELPDLRLELGDLRRGLLLRRGEALRVALRGLDGELRVLRAALAIVRELLEQLLHTLALLDDLRLQVAKELQHLFDWRHLLCRVQRQARGLQRAETQKQHSLHCSFVSAISFR